MEFDFDRIIDRGGTNSIATDGFREYLFEGELDVVLPCADSEALAMWVADMAFASAPAAIDAMQRAYRSPDLRLHRARRRRAVRRVLRSGATDTTGGFPNVSIS